MTDLPDTRLPPISILDLAPIVEGGSASAALSNSLDLAQHAERWGYKRFWLAEHHNSSGIASAATSVVIVPTGVPTAELALREGRLEPSSRRPDICP